MAGGTAAAAQVPIDYFELAQAPRLLGAIKPATAGFDKETLLKLQELFAELDADGSGYLDAEELGVLFKNMRMPMGQRELDDIVDEIDVDGNGV